MGFSWKQREGGSRVSIRRSLLARDGHDVSGHAYLDEIVGEHRAELLVFEHQAEKWSDARGIDPILCQRLLDVGDVALRRFKWI